VEVRSVARKLPERLEPAWVISIVGIEDHEELAGRGSSCPVACRRGTTVLLADRRHRSPESGEGVADVVTGAVVDNDDLVGRSGLLQGGGDRPADGRGSFVGGDDDREARLAHAGSLHECGRTTLPSASAAVGRSPIIPGSTSKKAAACRPSWMWRLPLTMTSIRYRPGSSGSASISHSIRGPTSSSLTSTGAESSLS